MFLDLSSKTDLIIGRKRCLKNSWTSAAREKENGDWRIFRGFDFVWLFNII